MNLLDKINDAKGSKQILESTCSNLTHWVQASFLPDWALGAITELFDKEAWEELDNRFYKNLEFGTGGMRGRTVGLLPVADEQISGKPHHAAVGSNCLNDFNIIQATIGLFNYTKQFLEKQNRSDEIPKLIIAHDVRYFSRHFCELSASTWAQLEGEAFIFDGPRSTPQLSFFVKHLNLHTGIVITASHNPPHDNGFKAYFEDGAQVVSPHAEGIIKQAQSIDLESLKDFYSINLENVTTLTSKDEAAYLAALEELILEPELIKKQKPKIVFSPIHGTGGVVSIPLMKSLGIDVTVVEDQMELNPSFPSVKSPNPENAEALSLAVALADKENIDLVMATDPDADRMGVAVRNSDGKMQLLTGNMIGSILAEYRIVKSKEKGWIPQNGSPSVALIKTFVTTPLQEAIAQTNGLKLINTLTGFKWIGQKLDHYEKELKHKYLQKKGKPLDYNSCSYRERAKLLQEYSTFYLFGGEESYGYLAGDRVRDKDANAAVLMFCELAAYLKDQGITFLEYLDAIYIKYGYYKEKLLTLKYEGATGAQKIKAILESYRAAPPKAIADQKVISFKDFGKDDVFDIDGQEIPKQDFYFVELKNGYRYAVRGSGTEPKIKFYLFGCANILEANELEQKKLSVGENLLALEQAILQNVKDRLK